MKCIVTRPQPKLNSISLLSGIGVGAALMYYLDPSRGARRRGLLRDKLVHAANVTGEAVGTTRRDLANRARGLAAEVRTLGNDEEVDDDVVEARVRSELGRVVAHPGAIEVKAEGGRAFGERTLWEVDGPAGSTVVWEAETTRLDPNEQIAWKSVEGEPIRQAGRIRFEPNDRGGTRAHIELRYNPPGGYAGHAVASLFKRDPRRQMNDDLARLKTVIETGRAPRDAAASKAGATRDAMATPEPLDLKAQ